MNKSQVKAWVARMNKLQVRDAKICAYYAKGYSLRECGEEFGLTFERVRQILKANQPDLIRPPHDTRNTRDSARYYEVISAYRNLTRK